MVEFKPMDAGISPRYAQISTFMRLPHSRDIKNYDVAIIGVPYDGGTSYRPGTRFGPREIRSYSSLIRGYSYYSKSDLFSRLRIADYGDIDASPYNIELTYKLIEDTIESILNENVFPVVIGGDHSISLGILRAVAKKYGPVGLVQFDAHSDTYDGVYGTEYHHGTPFKRAIEEGLIDPSRSLQIGIRGQFVSSTDLDYALQSGMKILMMDDINKKGISDVIKNIEGLGKEPVYVSLDIDAVDPAFAPGTGTPVPGGFDSREIIQLIRSLKPLNVVGFDLVEVSPPYDNNGITSLLASNLIYEFLNTVSLEKKS
ncbi:agmatinase [Anoxybacteroides rupiense]|uniref:agmatinase n=1 Tax=Anoxybacteroides rupiense TaxID=311460 RepID=UPI0016062026|nr:agmatinase [Anoxybacillus rupiensis]MBB3907509.1 agmatinase [Anoxybacillus rupiensis]